MLVKIEKVKGCKTLRIFNLVVAWGSYYNFESNYYNQI